MDSNRAVFLEITGNRVIFLGVTALRNLIGEFRRHISVSFRTYAIGYPNVFNPLNPLYQGDFKRQCASPIVIGLPMPDVRCRSENVRYQNESRRHLDTRVE